MAIKRFRLPGLQVPASAQGELLAFLEAAKERLELISGERGDPGQRSVAQRELLATSPAPSSGGGSGGNTSEQFDFSLYPPLNLAEADGNLQLLVQGLSINERFRLLLNDFLTMFGRLDQESAPQFPWSFQADEYGFDITGPAPRFRFVELSEDSDTEPSRPADSNVWEVEVDGSALSVWLVNDEDDTRVRVIRIVRSGMAATAFEYGGSQVLTRADVRTAEVNLSSPARLSGRFTLTDALVTPTSKLIITLAPGPYTGKGTRADEAEMYAGIGFAATPAAGSATVYWSAPHRMRGNVKVNYLIG